MSQSLFFGRTSGSDEVKLFYENCALNFRLLSPFFVCSHVMTIATTKPWWLAKPSNPNHQKICFQSTFFLLAPKIHLFSQLIAICKCQGKISLELEKLNGMAWMRILVFGFLFRQVSKWGTSLTKIFFETTKGTMGMVLIIKLRFFVATTHLIFAWMTNLRLGKLALKVSFESHMWTLNNYYINAI